jgi:hypothetical protein
MSLSFQAFFIALFAILKRWKIVLFFFLLNFLLSILMMLPLFRAISSGGGRYEGMDRFLALFDSEVLLDFLNGHDEVISTALLTAGMIGVVYLFLYHVLSGGMITILADPREKTSMKTFLRGCGRFAFRFTRLFFYFSLSLVAISFINTVLNEFLFWYFIDFKEYSAGSSTLGWLLFGKNVFMMLLVAFNLVAFNYAKTAVVVEDRHFMGSAFTRGFGFTVTHPVITGIFFVLATALLTLVLYAYGLLSRRIDPNGVYDMLKYKGTLSLSGAVVFLVLAQLTQLLIQACLVMRHAGQIYIFKYLTVQEAKPDPELESPNPYTPFIPDRPISDQEDTQDEMEEGQSHV